LRVRYTTSEKGKPVKQAEIYTPEEHGIKNQDVDPDALKIIRRLRNSGHSAYVVGGAVRDLALGKKPKDFDIATDASPARIRRLFRNSRIIGKRFRLVHIFFREKILEVSTFRSEESEGFKNVYGAIEEDVRRRDFTLNALYYSPEDRVILDYVGGFKDIQARRIKPVIPLERIFSEDPVRMIRAIKYSVTSGSRLTGPLKRQLKKSTSLLADCPPSRMTEEAFKILLSGYAAPIMEELSDHALLRYILPAVDFMVGDKAFAFYRKDLFESLERLDAEVSTDGVDRARAIAHLCADFLFSISDLGKQQRIPFKEAFSEMKQFIRPLAPANKDVEKALVLLIRKKKSYRKTGRL